MPAHSAPQEPRNVRTTILTSVATALAVVGLMVAGSALTSSPTGRDTLGTDAGRVRLIDAPLAPAPMTTSTTPAARTSTPASTTTSRPSTTTRKTTTTTSSDSDD